MSEFEAITTIIVEEEDSWPATHIDWHGAWRDLEYDGYWSTYEGHVFRPI